MSKYDSMEDQRPHLANPELMAKIDASLRSASARPTTDWRDHLQRLRQGYGQQWQKQPFNFGCMHFAAIILVGAIYFAVFILPSAF